MISWGDLRQGRLSEPAAQTVRRTVPTQGSYVVTRSRPYPLHSLSTGQLVNGSTSGASLWPTGQLINGSTLRGPSGPHHPLHPNTPTRDFFDFIEGDRGGATVADGGEESGERFGVTFAAGGTAQPGWAGGGSQKIRRA
jgi:hypothetical protein